MLPPEVRCRVCTVRHGGAFCNFSRQALATFQRIGWNRTLAAGEVICRSGEPSDGIYIVCEGEVRVSRRQRGRQASWTVSPGEVIGLEESLGRQPFRIVAETITPAVVRFVPIESFHEFLEDEIDAAIWTSHFL